MMSICDLQEIWALHIWLADLGERSAGWLGDGEIYVHTPFGNAIIHTELQSLCINRKLEF